MLLIHKIMLITANPIYMVHNINIWEKKKSKRISTNFNNLLSPKDFFLVQILVVYSSMASEVASSCIIFFLLFLNPVMNQMSTYFLFKSLRKQPFSISTKSICNICIVCFSFGYSLKEYLITRYLCQFKLSVTRFSPERWNIIK